MLRCRKNEVSSVRISLPLRYNVICNVKPKFNIYSILASSSHSQVFYRIFAVINLLNLQENKYYNASVLGLSRWIFQFLGDGFSTEHLQDWHRSVRNSPRGERFTKYCLHYRFKSWNIFRNLQLVCAYVSMDNIMNNLAIAA